MRKDAGFYVTRCCNVIQCLQLLSILSGSANDICFCDFAGNQVCITPL